MNVPSTAAIDTALDATPAPLLLDSVADDGARSNAVRVRRTIYVPPPFSPILLAGKLSLAEAW